MGTLTARLAALAVKRGVSLGLLDQIDRDLVLAVAAIHLEAGRSHREAEVNAILEAWLQGSGAMLRVDHVELRRWLVDCGFVSRDGFGRSYVRGPAETDRVEALLGTVSAAALDAALADRRAAEAAARASRRLAHVAR